MNFNLINILLLQFPSVSPTEGAYYKRLPKSSAIKVIDFGSTAYGHHEHNYIVSTRHYRAPEVILGMLFNYCIDFWMDVCHHLFVVIKILACFIDQGLDGVIHVIYGVLVVSW